MLFFGGKDKKRVLIVDDDAGCRNLLRIFLEDEGYAVLDAVDGPTGLEIAWNRAPDLVIMDVMMPAMTGWDAVRALRTNPKTEKIPILMCTSLSRMRDVEKCLASGANDYISKPYDLARLRAKLLKLLEPPAEPEKPPA